MATATSRLGVCALILLFSTVLAGCGGAAARVESYMERGREHFSENNFDKARVEFSNALQIDPKNAEAQYWMGRVAERLNNFKGAAGHYQAAVDADAGHADARAALARLYLLGGLADRAFELAETGLATEAGHAGLLTVRAAARARLGDVPGAFQDAEAALAIAPSDPLAIAQLASLYRYNARSDRAIEIVQAGLEKLPDNTELRVILADLQLAQGNPEAAEAELRRIIEMEPRVVAHRQRLARFHLLEEDLPAAEQAMRDGLSVMPDSLEARLGLVSFIAAHKGAAEAEKQLLAFVAEDPESDDLRLSLGEFLQRQGDDERAEATYREIIDRRGDTPSALVARNRLAGMLAQRQDLEGAGKLVAEVLDANPRDNDALILRANLALARNDSTSAVNDLRAVLKDQPTAVPVMRALARAHLQNGETALAEETLRMAVSANPKDTAARVELAGILVNSRRLDQARPLLEEVVADAPEDVRAAELLFRVQQAQGDAKAARLTAEAVQRVRPDLAIGHYLAGLAAEAGQDADGAARAYLRALEIQPDGAEPLTALVRLEVRRNQPGRAMAVLDDTIEKYPRNVVVRNLKGELLTTQGRHLQAAGVFEEAIAIAPEWWIPYRGLALARLGASDSDGALAALRNGVAATKGAPPLKVDLAALYERLGRPNDAIDVYEDMLNGSPESAVAANNLAMLLVTYRSDPQSLDRAGKLADRLASATDPTYINTRGWVHYKRGEYDKALPLLQKAVDQSPASPAMRYHLGMAQLRSGDRASARRSLEAALEAERPFAGIEEARLALEEARQPG